MMNSRRALNVSPRYVDNIFITVKKKINVSNKFCYHLIAITVDFFCNRSKNVQGACANTMVSADLHFKFVSHNGITFPGLLIIIPT